MGAEKETGGRGAVRCAGDGMLSLEDWYAYWVVPALSSRDLFKPELKSSSVGESRVVKEYYCNFVSHLFYFS